MYFLSPLYYRQKSRNLLTVHISHRSNNTPLSSITQSWLPIFRIPPSKNILYSYFKVLQDFYLTHPRSRDVYKVVFDLLVNRK